MGGVVLAQDARPGADACLPTQFEQYRLQHAVEPVQVAERASAISQARLDGVQALLEVLEVPRPVGLREQAVDGLAVAPAPLDDALDAPDGLVVNARQVRMAGARELAAENPWQFQAWALGLVGARTATSAKKGSDKGIDGRILFHDEGAGANTKQIILSVKAGGTNVAHVRDLVGVLDREKAQIGVLLTMHEPTQPMRAEAASAGFYKSPWGGTFPRVQLITVSEGAGREADDYPSHITSTFKEAPKAEGPPQEEQLFGFE
jgi:Restriction endonuclease